MTPGAVRKHGDAGRQILMQLRLQTLPDLSVCLILRAFRPKRPRGWQSIRGTDASDDKDKESDIRQSGTTWMFTRWAPMGYTTPLWRSSDVWPTPFGAKQSFFRPPCGPQRPARLPSIAEQRPAEAAWGASRLKVWSRSSLHECRITPGLRYKESQISMETNPN